MTTTYRNDYGELRVPHRLDNPDLHEAFKFELVERGASFEVETRTDGQPTNPGLRALARAGAGRGIVPIDGAPPPEPAPARTRRARAE